MRPTWIRDAVEILSGWLPELLARAIVVVVLLLAGWAVARLAGWLSGRLLRRVMARFLRFLEVRAAFDEDAETPASDAELRNDASRLVDRVVFWFVFAFFLASALALLGFPIVGAWLTGLVAYLPRVLAATLVLVLGVFSARLLRTVVAAGLRRAGFVQAEAFGRMVQAAVILVAAVIAVDEVGIEVTFFIVIATTVLAALLGGVALAFGLGARDTVSNLVAAHYVSRTIRAGYRIRIGDQEGRIVDIQATSVTLETEQGHVMVPARFFNEHPCVLLEGDSE